MEVDIQLAQELAELTNPRPKACWKNSLDAYLALRYHDKDKAVDARYVEGHLIICEGSLPIAHGWLEVNGLVVDVTLPGQHGPEMYYPVFYYTMTEIVEEISRHNLMPLHENTHEGRVAMQNAWLELPQNAEIKQWLQSTRKEREL